MFDPDQPGAHVAAWQNAIAILDGSELAIRDAIERELAPIAQLSRIKITTANEVVDRLMRRITATRTESIKRAFRDVRARLGDEPILGKSLAVWAQYLAREDRRGIDNAVRTGLIAGLDNAEIARKVIGSVGVNGVDGVTEFTRHRIGQLGRAEIRALIRRKSPQT